MGWLKTRSHVRWVPSWFRSLTTNESFKMPNFETGLWRWGILMGGQVHGRFLGGNDLLVLWHKWGDSFWLKKGSCKSSSEWDQSHRCFSRRIVILGFDVGVLVSCCFPSRCAKRTADSLISHRSEPSTKSHRFTPYHCCVMVNGWQTEITSYTFCINRFAHV